MTVAGLVESRMIEELITVTTFVHPVNPASHPRAGPGWRWAVHLGQNPTDITTCLNAGWCPNEREAQIEGQAVAVAVTHVLTIVHHNRDIRGLLGHRRPVQFVHTLDYDPIPPEE